MSKISLGVTLKDIMYTDVVTGKLDDSVYSLFEKCSKNNISTVVIVDALRKPLGMGSREELIGVVARFREGALKMKIKDILRGEHFSLSPSDDIETAEYIMNSNMIKCLTITVDGKLAGIVTRTDILAIWKTQCTHLTEVQNRLSHKIQIDSMSGLYNKQYMVSELNAQIEICHQTGNSLCLLMMDIDNFKKINDTYGHVCGDEAIIHVAGILNAKKRGIDLVGRYGGDEFMLICILSDMNSAIRIAERMRSSIEQSQLQLGGTVIRLTTSIGVAGWTPDVKNALSLIRIADNCLYAAKQEGRNRVCHNGIILEKHKNAM